MSRDLEALAAKTAVRAGELVKNMRENGNLGIETKSSAVDMVTEADKLAEKLITKLVLAERPDDSILGEEGGLSVTGTTEVTWVIDPIDGTTSYVYGQDACCVSIAATIEVEPEEADAWRGAPSSPARKTVAAAIYNPFTDELFTASEGNGARLNDNALRVNGHSELSTALIATGFGYTVEERTRQAEVLLTLLPQVRDIRRLGSAAYDLCLYAGGRLDGYYERGLQEWDFAAGVLIVAEAGGTIAGLNDGVLPGTGTLITADAALATQLQQLIAV